MNARRLVVVGLLAVALALSVGLVTPAGAQWVTNFFGRTFTSSAPTGTNGFACRTSGCRVDLGTGANDHLLSNGTYVYSPGTLGIATAASIYESQATITAPAPGAWLFRGAVPSTAFAEAAIKIGNAAALNAIDGKIISLYSDNMVTERAYFDSGGSLWTAGWVTAPVIAVTPAALQTCANGLEGVIVSVGGAGAVPTKICACLYTPTGAVYAWRNLTANSAGTGIGTASTCP